MQEKLYISVVYLMCLDLIQCILMNCLMMRMYSKKCTIRKFCHANIVACAYANYDGYDIIWQQSYGTIIAYILR